MIYEEEVSPKGRERKSKSRGKHQQSIWTTADRYFRRIRLDVLEIGFHLNNFRLDHLRIRFPTKPF